MKLKSFNRLIDYLVIFFVSCFYSSCSESVEKEIKKTDRLALSGERENFDSIGKRTVQFSTEEPEVYGYLKEYSSEEEEAGKKKPKGKSKKSSNLTKSRKSISIDPDDKDIAIYLLQRKELYEQIKSGKLPFNYENMEIFDKVNKDLYKEKTENIFNKILEYHDLVLDPEASKALLKYKPALDEAMDNLEGIKGGKFNKIINISYFEKFMMSNEELVEKWEKMIEEIETILNKKRKPQD